MDKLAKDLKALGVPVHPLEPFTLADDLRQADRGLPRQPQGSGAGHPHRPFARRRCVDRDVQLARPERRTRALRSHLRRGRADPPDHRRRPGSAQLLQAQGLRPGSEGGAELHRRHQQCRSHRAEGHRPPQHRQGPGPAGRGDRPRHRDPERKHRKAGKEEIHAAGGEGRAADGARHDRSHRHDSCRRRHGSRAAGTAPAAAGTAPAAAAGTAPARPPPPLRRSRKRRPRSSRRRPPCRKRRRPWSRSPIPPQPTEAATGRRLGRRAGFRRPARTC